MPVNFVNVVDKLAQYTPIVSSGYALGSIVAKVGKKIFSSPAAPQGASLENRVSLLDSKSFTRLFTLMIPVFGNLVVALYDLISACVTSKAQKPAQESSGSSASIEDVDVYGLQGFNERLEEEQESIYQQAALANSEKFDMYGLHGFNERLEEEQESIYQQAALANTQARQAELAKKRKYTIGMIGLAAISFCAASYLKSR